MDAQMRIKSSINGQIFALINKHISLLKAAEYDKYYERTNRSNIYA